MWIKDLNRKSKTTKLVIETVGKYFGYLMIWRYFLIKQNEHVR